MTAAVVCFHLSHRYPRMEPSLRCLRAELSSVPRRSKRPRVVTVGGTANAVISVGDMRTDVINPEEYFMAVAMTTAKRSRDPTLQVGACVVDSHGRVRSVGYNSMPRGDYNSYPWSNDNDDPIETKRLYICHAEENAIIPHPGIPNGCIMYVTCHPCNMCAKIIVQSGIKEVVYKNKYKDSDPRYQASKVILKKSGVKLRQYKPTGTELLCKL